MKIKLFFHFLSIEFEEYVENLNLRLVKLSNFKEKSKKKFFFKSDFFSINSYLALRSKTAQIFSKAYGWNWFFPLFFTWKNIRLPILGTSICLKQVILTKKSEQMKKNHEKWPFLSVDGKINLRNDHFCLIGYRKHSKAFRNNVCMQSCGIMFLDWSLFELYDMVDECYLDLSWLIFSLIKEGGGRLLKAILYRGDLTQNYKNCTDNLEKGCWTQEKKLHA